MPKNSPEGDPKDQAASDKPVAKPALSKVEGKAARPAPKPKLDATSAASVDKSTSKTESGLPLEPAMPITDATSSGWRGRLGSVKRPNVSRGFLIKLGLAVVAVLLVFIAVFGVLIYVYKSDSTVVRAVSRVIPYPAERVNGTLVRYSDYLFQVDANERAYQYNLKLNNQSPVDFTSTAGKKLVTQIKQNSLDTLKTNAVVAQLAHQKKVTVTDKDVDNLVDQLAKQYGGKDTLLKTLKQIYNWNLGNLKTVIRQQLLSQKLQEKITSDPAALAKAKDKATDVDNQIKAGADFAETAKKYSQASDASSGGDLGTFANGDLTSDEQKVFDATPVGGVSDPFKTQYGYEIIKVTAKNGDQLQGSHILIESVDFNTYLTTQLKAAKVHQYIKV